MESLAIIAYRQPVTRSEIEYLRGVDSGSVVKTLLEKRLIRILGKKDVPGKPMIYGTTREFLELFGLPDLSSLPTLSEFSDLVPEEAEAEMASMPLLVEGDDSLEEGM
jgi:segregation and condensation protein B